MPQDDYRWRVTPLGDLVDIYDGPHATPKKAPKGPVFLGISNLDSGRLDLTQTKHVSEEDYLRWTRRITPRPNDIVFSYETRLGEAALIPKGLRACLGRRMGLLRPKSGAVDARFLLYAFLGDGFQDTLRSRTVYGSTVDRILLTELAEFPIDVPRTIEDQRAIAHILGTLDDKIELNRRMNETLEAMAHALFKSWFIDFDPVRAKMEGRDTGLPQDIADLFPDRLVNSEMGKIPAGWKVKSLSSFGKIVTGKTPSTRNLDFYGNDIPFLKIPDMRGKVYAVKTETMLSKYGADSQGNKTLPSGSISVSCIATPGLVVLNHQETQTNQQINSIVPYDCRAGTYLYWSCRRLASEIMLAGSGGSVFPNMNKSTFSALKIIDAGEHLRRLFDETIVPIHYSILNKGKTNQYLAELRDVLLPQLVSGELRLRATVPGMR